VANWLQGLIGPADVSLIFDEEQRGRRWQGVLAPENLRVRHAGHEVSLEEFMRYSSVDDSLWLMEDYARFHRINVLHMNAARDASLLLKPSAAVLAARAQLPATREELYARWDQAAPRLHALSPESFSFDVHLAQVRVSARTPEQHRGSNQLVRATYFKDQRYFDLVSLYEVDVLAVLARAVDAREASELQALAAELRALPYPQSGWNRAALERSYARLLGPAAKDCPAELARIIGGFHF
jgi:hypothetical protein